MTAGGAQDTDTFDVIVLGAGPAGENVAGRTAAGGLRTAVVESELVGGECSYWACIPSKTLLRPGAVLAAARRVRGAAGAVTGFADAKATFEQRDAAVSHYDDTGGADWVRGTGSELVRGHGRIVDERRVEVPGEQGSRLLTARRAVVVATGSSAVIPPIPGVDTVDHWDSRKATSHSQVPGRLAIVGGGVVAVEMAQAWKWLGVAEVVLLVRGSRLLEREEPFAGEELAAAFAEQGIDVRFNVSVNSLRAVDTGTEIALNDGSSFVADEFLVATGRRPNTVGIGLDSIGLEAGKPIKVDDHLRAVDVSGSWLYAVGDVNGRSLLTHMGKYQARACADVILGKDATAWADSNAVPAVVFTDPQVASVGLRLAAAKDKGINARQLKVPLDSAAGASVNGDQKGTAQVVVDDERRVIIGATFTGPDVAELLHSATIAIVGEVPLERLWHAVPSFPTLSEVWLRLLEADGF